MLWLSSLWLLRANSINVARARPILLLNQQNVNIRVRGQVLIRTAHAHIGNIISFQTQEVINWHKRSLIK